MLSPWGQRSWGQFNVVAATGGETAAAALGGASKPAPSNSPAEGSRSSRWLANSPPGTGGSLLTSSPSSAESHPAEHDGDFFCSFYHTQGSSLLQQG